MNLYEAFQQALSVPLKREQNWYRSSTENVELDRKCWDRRIKQPNGDDVEREREKGKKKKKSKGMDKNENQ